MTYIEMAQAIAWLSVKYIMSPCSAVLFGNFRRAERRMLFRFSPKVCMLLASPTLMAYQNFFTRKYHWIVKASMMKFSTRPPTENSFK